MNIILTLGFVHYNLATKGHLSDKMEQGRLTNAQKVHLAREISCQNMESIALGYLGFDQEVMNSLKIAHRDNLEAFNRDILHRWTNQNDGTDQVQVGKHSFLYFPLE